MFLEILCEDHDIVEVHHHVSFIDEISEDFIHHGLERGWRIGEAEEHDEWLEEAFLGNKSGFPFVPFFDADVVESPSDVELGEVPGSLKLVQELLN